MKDEVCETHKIRKYYPECSRCHGEGEIEADDDVSSTVKFAVQDVVEYLERRFKEREKKG